MLNDRGRGSRAPSATAAAYLRAVADLGQDGRPIIAARLAEWLGVTPSTVTAMLQRLRREGLVEAADRRVIRLTAAGRAEAESIVRRHHLAERLLTDLIGVPWSRAHAEAGRWEHAISTETEALLQAILGHPQTCPHGNPIPGTGGRLSASCFPLADAEAGERLVISHLAERAETDAALLAFCETHQLRPGQRFSVTTPGPADGPVTLRRRDVVAAVDRATARLIYVLPARVAGEAPPPPCPRLRPSAHLAAALHRTLNRRLSRPRRGV